jgi:hypothetical protein
MSNDDSNLERKQKVDRIMRLLTGASNFGINISSSRDFYEIIGKVSICNFDEITKILIDIVKEFKILMEKNGDTTNFSEVERFYKNFYKTAHEQFTWMFLYYQKVKEYFNNNYSVYSLGSSLEKVNLVYSLLKEEIIEIPFSGSMYDYIPGTTNIILNEEKKALMMTSYKDLLKNNTNFKLLVDRLNNNDKRVVITDVKAQGKSLLTLLTLFKANDVNMDNLYFFYITTDDEPVPNNFIYTKTDNDLRREFVYNNSITFLNTIDIEPIFIHGEDFGTRCITRYNYTEWTKQPTDIYFDEDIKDAEDAGDDFNITKSQINNYLKCNFNNMFFYLFSVCFFEKFVKPNIDKFKGTSKELEIMIKFFIMEKFINNYENYPPNLPPLPSSPPSPSVSPEGEPPSKRHKPGEMKYLKYKMKYLKLKEMKNKNMFN